MAYIMNKNQFLFLIKNSFFKNILFLLIVIVFLILCDIFSKNFTLLQLLTPLIVNFFAILINLFYLVKFIHSFKILEKFINIDFKNYKNDIFPSLYCKKDKNIKGPDSISFYIRKNNNDDYCNISYFIGKEKLIFIVSHDKNIKTHSNKFLKFIHQLDIEIKDIFKHNVIELYKMNYSNEN